MLDSAFNQYRLEQDKDIKTIWGLFIKYLIEVHELKATPLMRTNIYQPLLRGLLQNEMVEPASEELYRSTTNPRL